jgi:hypothetical protein
MGPQDGVDYAVRALARLAERRDDWHAAFLGGGDAFDDVVDLAHRLGLDDRVTFTGMADTPDVRRYLSTACVGIAPDPLNPLNDVSTMNKIMEYMAMSRPIVSFDLKEARVSAGEAAVYAPANDESAFAELVSRLLDDPEDRARMGKIGQARVAGALSWDHSRTALVAAYEAAMAVRPAGSVVPRPRQATADVAAPVRTLPAAQPRQRPVEGEHGQVTAPVQRAHPAAADERQEGAQLQPALGGGPTELGELPVAPPDPNPPVQVRPDRAGRVD